MSLRGPSRRGSESPLALSGAAQHLLMARTTALVRCLRRPCRRVGVLDDKGDGGGVQRCAELDEELDQGVVVERLLRQPRQPGDSPRMCCGAELRADVERAAGRCRGKLISSLNDSWQKRGDGVVDY
eukprot:scaffold29014_cov118-Isochrysis_galbana.AAC.2